MGNIWMCVEVVVIYDFVCVFLILGVWLICGFGLVCSEVYYFWGIDLLVVSYELVSGNFL